MFPLATRKEELNAKIQFLQEQEDHEGVTAAEEEMAKLLHRQEEVVRISFASFFKIVKPNTPYFPLATLDSAQAQDGY